MPYQEQIYESRCSDHRVRRCNIGAFIFCQEKRRHFSGAMWSDVSIMLIMKFLDVQHQSKMIRLSQIFSLVCAKELYSQTIVPIQKIPEKYQRLARHVHIDDMAYILCLQNLHSLRLSYKAIILSPLVGLANLHSTQYLHFNLGATAYCSENITMDMMQKAVGILCSKVTKAICLSWFTFDDGTVLDTKFQNIIFLQTNVLFCSYPSSLRQLQITGCELRTSVLPDLKSLQLLSCEYGSLVIDTPDAKLPEIVFLDRTKIKLENSCRYINCDNVQRMFLHYLKNVKKLMFTKSSQMREFHVSHTDPLEEMIMDIPSMSCLSYLEMFGIPSFKNRHCFPFPVTLEVCVADVASEWLLTSLETTNVTKFIYNSIQDSKMKETRKNLKARKYPFEIWVRKEVKQHQSNLNHVRELQCYCNLKPCYGLCQFSPFGSKPFSMDRVGTAPLYPLFY